MFAKIKKELLNYGKQVAANPSSSLQEHKTDDAEVTMAKAYLAKTMLSAIASWRAADTSDQASSLPLSSFVDPDDLYRRCSNLDNVYVLGTFVPKGSYLATMRNIRAELTVHCKNCDEKYVPRTVDITELFVDRGLHPFEYILFNNNDGKLESEIAPLQPLQKNHYESQKKKANLGVYVPIGSYLDSCGLDDEAIPPPKLMLYGEKQVTDIGTHWYEAQLDISSSKLGDDIQENDFQFTGAQWGSEQERARQVG